MGGCGPWALLQDFQSAHWGLMCLQTTGRKNISDAPDVDVVQVQLLTPAVLTGQVSQALPVPLGYYYLHSQSSVCVRVRVCVL